MCLTVINKKIIGISLSLFPEKKEKIMKKFKHLLSVLLLVIFVVSGFMGCDMLGVGGGVDVDRSIAVSGTWQISGGWVEQWIITDTSIEYNSGASVDALSNNYKANIARYSNSDLNGGDTEIVTGGTSDHVGYAVIQYTEVNGPGTGTVGKYQIFRWGTTAADASQRDFTQGYKNVGAAWPNNVNEVFDSVAAAEAGVTNASGHFGGASSGAQRQ